MVLSKLPQVTEGRSPFSEPKKGMRILKHYTFLLSDGQLWNSRKLKLYRRRMEEGQMSCPDGNDPPIQGIRCVRQLHQEDGG